MKASTQSSLPTVLQSAPVNPGARPPSQRCCCQEALVPSISPQTRGSVQLNVNASVGRSAPEAQEGRERHAVHLTRGQVDRLRQPVALQNGTHLAPKAKAEASLSSVPLSHISADHRVSPSHPGQLLSHGTKHWCFIWGPHIRGSMHEDTEAPPSGQSLLKSLGTKTAICWDALQTDSTRDFWNGRC